MEQRTTFLQRLAQAQQQLAHGAVLIAEQEQRIADLRRGGHDTSGSEALLNTLLESQHLHEESVSRILHEISKLNL
jgi:hypothetical protein